MKVIPKPVPVPPPENPERLKHLRRPTMQVIRLTTTDGIAHEFFGPSLLRNDPNDPNGHAKHTRQPACIQSVDFGPELTIADVQEILAYHALHHALYPNPATDRSFN